MSKKPDSDKMESFKDPFYKKMWFWMLIGSALFIIMAIGSISANNNAISSAQKSDTSSNSHSPSGDSEKSEIEQRASIAEEKRLKSLERAETERVAKEAEEKAQAAKAAAEKAAQEAAAKAAAKKAAKDAADRDPNSYQALPYDEMARNGDNHKGEKLQITGKVIQVMDSDKGFATLRVATRDGYEDVYLVQIPADQWKSHRLLEDDVITFYGEVYGLYSYSSTMGGKITVPAINVNMY